MGKILRCVGLCLVTLPVLVWSPEAIGQAKVRDAITILTPQEWLHVYSDGSGVVGYGAGGGNNDGQLKAGTFDVAAVTKQLKALPLDKKGAVDTHYRFAFESERRGQDNPGPLYFTSDKKVIDSLFRKAAKASGWDMQGRFR